MKTLLSALLFACATVAQANPGLSTATGISFPGVARVIFPGQSVITPVLSPEYDETISVSNGSTSVDVTFTAKAVDTGTFLYSYRCAYSFPLGQTFIVLPPNPTTVTWTSGGVAGGMFSMTASSTQQGAAPTLVVKNGFGNLTSTGQLSSRLTPLEVLDSATPNVRQKTLDYDPSVMSYGVNTHPNQQVIDGIVYGTHEEAILVSYLPGVSPAQVNGQDTRFSRSLSGGVTIWPSTFSASQGPTFLAVGFPGLPLSIPGITGLVELDLTRDIVVIPVGPTGGVNLRAPLAYETSFLLQGYRTQMHQIASTGVFADVSIDW